MGRSTVSLKAADVLHGFMVSFGVMIFSTALAAVSHSHIQGSTLPVVAQGEDPANLHGHWSPKAPLEPPQPRCHEASSLFTSETSWIQKALIQSLRPVKLSVAQIKESFYISCHVCQRLPFQSKQILPLFLWQTPFCPHLSALLMRFLWLFFCWNFLPHLFPNRNPKGNQLSPVNCCGQMTSLFPSLSINVFHHFEAFCMFSSFSLLSLGKSHFPFQLQPLCHVYCINPTHSGSCLSLGCGLSDRAVSAQLRSSGCLPMRTVAFGIHCCSPALLCGTLLRTAAAWLAELQFPPPYWPSAPKQPQLAKTRWME